ncbi:MAG: hypothetical protein AAF478_10125 [Pseudomonadota bacterium]
MSGTGRGSTCYRDPSKSFQMGVFREDFISAPSLGVGDQVEQKSLC